MRMDYAFDCEQVWCPKQGYLGKNHLDTTLFLLAKPPTNISAEKILFPKEDLFYFGLREDY